MPKLMSLSVLVMCWTVAVPVPAEPLEVRDASGDGGSPVTDLVQAVVRSAPNGVEVAIRTRAPYSFANTQLLFDTDGNAGTGFSEGDSGHDVLIEGANLYAFSGGDQTAWQWTQKGEISRRVNENELRLVAPAERLGLDAAAADQRVTMVVRTLSESYTDVLDRLPDEGATQLKFEKRAESEGTPADAAERSTVDDPPGDTPDATRDIVRAAVRQAGKTVEFAVRTRAAGAFDQLLVFVDTDSKASTGYQSVHAEGCGFDFLLSGGQLHKFAGATQSAWSWSAVGDADVASEGSKWRARFDAGLLESRHARVVPMMMSADWQSLVDRAPDVGTMRLTLSGPLESKPQVQAQMAEPRANCYKPPRERFAAAESFYCFYGSNHAAELSHYDIVVAHSPQMAKEDIAALKKLGVVVVGYITLGEDDELRKGNGEGPDGYASWYFDQDGDGAPDKNKIWESYFVNANDPLWRADRIAEARRLVNDEGYDGIFLDTVGVAAELYPESKPGMIRLINELRAALPAAPIVQNQGFPLLADLADVVDGLMIESFTATYDFAKREYHLHAPSTLDWTRGIAESTIRPEVERTGLRVLVLDYAKMQDRESIQVAADRAATFGYLFAAAPIYLDAIYPPVEGKPDQKWLRRQATPETMKHVLKEAANGFPAGTVLLPSSCFGGYRVAPVVDGIADRSGLYWSEAAWASAEDGEPAWLEVRFPAPHSGGAVRIHWCVDNGRLHASREYQVEVRRGAEWQVVDRVRDNTRAVTEHELPRRAFDAVRLWQPANGGSVPRPGLCWVEQIELLHD